jgi:hypothetical protein
MTRQKPPEAIGFGPARRPKFLRLVRPCDKGRVRVSLLKHGLRQLCPLFRALKHRSLSMVED